MASETSGLTSREPPSYSGAALLRLAALTVVGPAGAVVAQNLFGQSRSDAG
jgi:hypothetical protein